VKVEKFLTAFRGTIRDSSESLMCDIADLELHDLSILNSMRLYKEEESYSEYLVWLFSEALSAKIRNSGLLVGAGQSVNDIKLTPFSGMLEPRSLLFKLYSEIAFSYSEAEGGSHRIHFGDVYYANSQKRERKLRKSNLRRLVASRQDEKNSCKDIRRQEVNEQAGRGLSFSEDQIFLVISPACDLIRCSSDSYQVTCVRGVVVHSAPRLADLFDQKYVFGENRHLMKVDTLAGEKYQVINWNPKDIVTIPFGSLRDVNLYGRKARMNELFCHELKESALRMLGRVGVPVDPSFSIPLGAMFNFIGAEKNVVKIVAPHRKFVSAIRLAGNKLNERKIVFTEEFNSWFGDALRDYFSGQELPKKLAKLNGVFQKGGIVEFNLEKNKEPSLIDGVGKLIYLNEYSAEQCTADLALYVFPWKEEYGASVH
jgi:hypothetical protein